MRSWWDSLKEVWAHEEKRKIQWIAHRYYLRSHMDGEVVQKTGEVIPKESV